MAFERIQEILVVVIALLPKAHILTDTFVLRSDKEVDMTGLQRPRCNRTW